MIEITEECVSIAVCLLTTECRELQAAWHAGVVSWGIFKARITQQAKKFKIVGSNGRDRVSVNSPPGLKEGP